MKTISLLPVNSIFDLNRFIIHSSFLISTDARGIGAFHNSEIVAISQRKSFCFEEKEIFILNNIKK